MECIEQDSKPHRPLLSRKARLVRKSVPDTRRDKSAHDPHSVGVFRTPACKPSIRRQDRSEMYH